VIKLKAQMDNKANNKPADDYKRRRTDSFDNATGPETRRRGDEPAHNSYGYRGNTIGWRGTPRSNSGRGRGYRGANLRGRRGGGY
jgi:hypothetical protein